MRESSIETELLAQYYIEAEGWADPMCIRYVFTTRSPIFLEDPLCARLGAGESQKSDTLNLRSTQLPEGPGR